MRFRPVQGLAAAWVSDGVMIRTRTKVCRNCQLDMWNFSRLNCYPLLFKSRVSTPRLARNVLAVNKIYGLAELQLQSLSSAIVQSSAPSYHLEPSELFVPRP